MSLLFLMFLLQLIYIVFYILFLCTDKIKRVMIIKFILRHCENKPNMQFTTQEGQVHNFVTTKNKG